MENQFKGVIYSDIIINDRNHVFNFKDILKFSSTKLCLPKVLAQKNLILLYIDKPALFNSYMNDIIENANSKPLQCSMRAYDKKQCPSYIYSEQKKNYLYLDQWFHVNIFEIDKLSDQQKDQLNQSTNFMFLTKILYSVKNNDLIDVSFYSSTFPDSMITVAPSRLSNYANSARETCNGANNLETYDARCRQWYKDAYNQKSFSASQRNNDTDGSFISMFNQNLGLKNIKQKIFANQDIYDESDPQEAYTILINYQNQTIYHHRYWTPEDRVLKTWNQLEYNSTTYYEPKDKEDFNENIDRITQFGQTGNYDILYRNNTDNFFFKFKRNNDTYLSILYPVRVMSIQNSQTKEIVYNKPMFIGRVQKDRTNILQEVTLEFLPLNQLILKVELGAVFFWLILNMLHYGAVLYNSQEIPLSNLIKAIKNHTIQKDFLKKDKRNNNSQINTQFAKAKHHYNQNTNEQLSPQKSAMQTQHNPYFTNTNNQNSQIAKSVTNNLNSSIFKKIFSNKIQTLQISQKETSQAQLLEKNFKFQTEVELQKQNLQSSNKVTNLITEDLLNQSSIYQSSIGLSHKRISVYEDYQQNHIDLDDVDLMFIEMEIIVHSIKGIFHLLKLAKMNNLKGNNDLSILQFCQALEIFTQVRNHPQQVICYQQIGNQYIQQLRFNEAAESYESALHIMLYQLDLSNFNDVLTLVSQGEFKDVKRQIIEDFAVILRMLAIAQIEEYNETFQQQNEFNINLYYASLQNINLSIQILERLQNKSQIYQKLIQSQFIKAEILNYKDTQSTYFYCLQLEDTITSNLIQSINNFDQSFTKIVSKIKNNYIYEIILQHIFILKQKILIEKGNIYQASLNITDLLESSEYLSEYIKHHVLQQLNSIFKIASIQNDSFLQDELDKYLEIRLNINIMIEIDTNLSTPNFERYQQYISQIVKLLNPDDVISFTFYSNQIVYKSSEFQCQYKLSLQTCLKELKQCYTQLILKKNNLKTMDWLDPCYHQILQILDSSQSVSYYLKQKNSQFLNINPIKQEKKIIILFTSSNFCDISHTQKLKEVYQNWIPSLQQIQNKYQKVTVLHYQQNQCLISDLFNSDQQDQFFNEIKDLSLINSTQNPLQGKSFAQSSRLPKNFYEFNHIRKLYNNKEAIKFEEANSIGVSIEKTANQDTDEFILNNLNGLGFFYKKIQEYTTLFQEIKFFRYNKPQTKYQDFF